MDTTTGRFTSMDSYLGSVDDPVSLHKYLYANANPVNYIDPSGYNSYGEMNLALKIQLILTDITTLKINMYCWYIRLGEASIGGKILKEVIDESFELLLEGDVDIYSIMWTGVEVVYGLANSEQEFSTLKKGNKLAKKVTQEEIVEGKKIVNNRINNMIENMTEGEKSRTTYGSALVRLQDGTTEMWVSSAGKKGYVPPRIRGNDKVIKNKSLEANSINRFNDAEQTIMREANEVGAEIISIGATRPMCPACQAVANKNGIIDRVATPLKKLKK